MTGRYARGCLALVVAMVIPPSYSGAATLLFQRTLEVSRSPNPYDIDQFDLDLTFGDAFSSPTNPTTLFDDLVLSPADFGSTFVANTTTDSSFDEVASRLTDGLNQYYRLDFTENEVGGLGQQQGGQEHMFFTGLGTPTDPDLAGAMIESISLTVDQFTFVSNGLGPPPVHLLLTVRIEGSVVPEPSALLLLGLGLLSLDRRARRSLL